MLAAGDSEREEGELGGEPSIPESAKRTQEKNA